MNGSLNLLHIYTYVIYTCNIYATPTRSSPVNQNKQVQEEVYTCALVLVDSISRFSVRRITSNKLLVGWCSAFAFIFLKFNTILPYSCARLWRTQVEVHCGRLIEWSKRARVLQTWMTGIHLLPTKTWYLCDFVIDSVLLLQYDLIWFLVQVFWRPVFIRSNEYFQHCRDFELWII